MGKALELAQQNAIDCARAKAEIAIERILNELTYKTMVRVERVEIDTQNFPSPVVEITLSQ